MNNGAWSEAVGPGSSASEPVKARSAQGPDCEVLTKLKKPGFGGMLIGVCDGFKGWPETIPRIGGRRL